MLPARSPSTIDEYIASFPEAVRERLEIVRAAIRKAAPGAREAIRYGMPTFTLNGNLVYFAAFNRHVGLYSFPSGNPAFRQALAHYKTGKGSIQLPHSQPLPLDLIGAMVRFRVQENLSRPAKQKATAAADSR